MAFRLINSYDDSPPFYILTDEERESYETYIKVMISITNISTFPFSKITLFKFLVVSIFMNKILYIRW